MKALTITRFGGPDVLKIVESADPVPGEGELLIAVKRAGLNFSDIAARVGLYPDAPKPPMVVGYEVSGVVAGLGTGVTGFTVGDRVIGMTRFKGQATHLVVKQGQVKKLPDALSFDQGAAMPVNYLTAYHMLFHVASLRPGDKVLIHMAAGGVGLSAIELCKLVEGVEIFGTASAGKHELLRKAGVQHPIDYHSTDYAAEVMKLTGGKGVNIVLDALGGPDWEKGFNLLRPGAGHLVCFGWANMVSGEKRSLVRLVTQFAGMARYSPMRLMDKNRSISGVNVGHLWGELDLMNAHLEKVVQLAVEGKVKPHVDRVFPLSQGAEAHRHVGERKNVGKVVFDCEQ